MKYNLHKSESRGYANHGWLQAKHSFSFADYFDATRMNFGVLRVLNNDIIAPGKGFGTHPHDNMEIITIPLEGALSHKDSMGNSSTIHAGEIQVMSAGSGIYHSEFNASNTNPIELFQIWIYPNKKNVEPRYQQISLQDISSENSLYQILSPHANESGVWIYQDAWIYMGNFTTDTDCIYKVHSANTGTYTMVIEGEISIESIALSKRDAIGIWNSDEIRIRAHAHSKILIIEVPFKDA